MKRALLFLVLLTTITGASAAPRRRLAVADFHLRIFDLAICK